MFSNAKLHPNSLVFKTLRFHQLLTTVLFLSPWCSVSFIASTNHLLAGICLSTSVLLVIYLQKISSTWVSADCLSSKENCHGLRFCFAFLGFCFGLVFFSEIQLTFFVMAFFQYFSGQLSYQHFDTTSIISILSLPWKNDWPEFHLSFIKVETLPSSLLLFRPFLIRQMQNSNLASPLKQKFPGYLSDHVSSSDGARWMLLPSWKQLPCVSLNPEGPAKFLLGPTTKEADYGHVKSLRFSGGSGNMD